MADFRDDSGQAHHRISLGSTALCGRGPSPRTRPDKQPMGKSQTHVTCSKGVGQKYHYTTVCSHWDKSTYRQTS